MDVAADDRDGDGRVDGLHLDTDDDGVPDTYDMDRGRDGEFEVASDEATGEVPEGGPSVPPSTGTGSPEAAVGPAPDGSFDSYDLDGDGCC